MTNYLKLMGVCLGIGVSLVLGACGGTIGSSSGPGAQDPSRSELGIILNSLYQTGRSPFLGPEIEPDSFITDVFSGSREYFGIGMNVDGLFVANTSEGLMGFDGDKSLWQVSAVSINGFVTQAGARKDPVVLSNGDSFYLSSTGLMVRVNSLGIITGKADLNGGTVGGYTGSFFLTPNLNESSILFSHESGRLVFVDTSTMEVSPLSNNLSASDSLVSRPVFMNNQVLALLILNSEGADRVEFVSTAGGSRLSTFSLPSELSLLRVYEPVLVNNELLVFGTREVVDPVSSVSSLYAIAQDSDSERAGSFWKSSDISGGNFTYLGSPAVGDNHVYVMQTYSIFPKINSNFLKINNAALHAFSLEEGLTSTSNPVWSFSPEDPDLLARFNAMSYNHGVSPVVDAAGKVFLAGRSALFVISDDGESASLAVKDPFLFEGETFSGRPHLFSNGTGRYILAPLFEDGAVSKLSLLKETL